MLGDVNKLFVFKSLFTKPSNVLPLHFKQTFLPIIWTFTEGVGDGIESRLPFKIFSTLLRTMIKILENVFYFQYYWVGFMIIFSWDPNTKWNKPSNYLGLSIAKTSSIRIAATKIWVKKVDSGVLVTFKVHLRTSILGNN